MHEGRLKYCYNFFGIHYFFATADRPLPAGKHQVRMEFAYDGGGLAKGGNVTLYYDGNAVGTGRVDITVPMGFSADEACDIGRDTGSPASPDYGPHGNRFHRNHRLGADRHRRRQPRPPHQTGGSAEPGHGQAVGRRDAYGLHFDE